MAVSQKSWSLCGEREPSGQFPLCSMDGGDRLHPQLPVAPSDPAKVTLGDRCPFLSFLKRLLILVFSLLSNFLDNFLLPKQRNIY